MQGVSRTMVQDILSQKYLEGADTAQLPPVYAPSAYNLPNPLVSQIVLPTRHTSQRTHPSPSAGPPPIVPVPTRLISTPPDPSPAHAHPTLYHLCAHPININAQTLRLPLCNYVQPSTRRPEHAHDRTIVSRARGDGKAAQLDHRCPISPTHQQYVPRS